MNYLSQQAVMTEVNGTTIALTSAVCTDATLIMIIKYNRVLSLGDYTKKYLQRFSWKSIY